jgi:hypothetical protein
MDWVSWTEDIQNLSRNEIGIGRFVRTTNLLREGPQGI